MNQNFRNTFVAILAGVEMPSVNSHGQLCMPKQYTDFLGVGKTLVQQTYERFRGIIPVKNIFVITARSLREVALLQLPMLPEENIICEPEWKDTAPAIAYLSFKLLQRFPDSSLIVAPADHLILQQHAFYHLCGHALDIANSIGGLITLGVQPTHANSGYGYIKRKETEVVEGVFEVACFIGKSKIAQAKQYQDKGEYLWNSRIFIWTITDILAAFELHLPTIFKAFCEAASAFGTRQEAAAIQHAYKECCAVSIDVGIMENAANVYVIPAAFGWSDISTWNEEKQVLLTRV